MSERIRYPATLLMESHGLAPNVRSTSFSSVRVWSKLYQAGPYFLDLHLAPGDEGMRLRGELLTTDDTPLPSRGVAALHGGASETEALATLELGAEHTFAVPIAKPDLYQIVVTFDETTISVDDLEIS